MAITAGGVSILSIGDPPHVSDMWTILSGRPYATSTSTGSMAKDLWRFVPCSLGAPLPIKALSVETTVAATGGTAALIFAIYNVGTDGRPSTVLADLSGAGSIDLTATAGVLTRTGISTTLPAGTCFIGCGWTGTATGAPTVRILATSDGRVIDSNAGVISRNGYLAGASGATPPSPAGVSTAATTAIVIFGQIQ